MPRHCFCFVVVMLSMVFASNGQTLAQDGEPAKPDPAKLWTDFNHYVLIARPDLAQAAGSALLSQVDDAQLLDIVEASDYTDYQKTTIPRAQNMSAVADTANQLAGRIQKARIARSREVARIGADIEALDGGLRAYGNAVERLRGAGQYAAPHLLATLLDPQQSKLHPYVLTATVAIGQPLVYPLSEALPKLDPVPMGQIAQVLGEIGYPMALPYLKLVLEQESVDPQARSIVQAAYDRVLQNMGKSEDLGAAELFLLLGMNQYDAGTRNEEMVGYDVAESKGIVWEYTSKTGLVPIPVPGAIYGDVMAMRSAQYALHMQPALDPALSLWLMANLRRENRLPQGEQDPSYSADLQPASFYALLAGPLRQHEVLNRALVDRDPELALDAIRALDQTAGTAALLNLEGPIQPLLSALSFPDRRVRYEAAFALTSARPTEAFAGSHQVVPVLAEAVRQSEQPMALIVADNAEQRNTLQAALKDLGYATIAGGSMSEVAEQIRSTAGVDLIVAQLDVAGVQDVFEQSAANYKLASVPILAVITPTQQLQLDTLFHNQKRLFTTAADAEPQALTSAVEEARGSAVGAAIDDDQSTTYAVTSLSLLRDLALQSGDVYAVTDAQPALTLALADGRDAVVTGAAAVLALIENAEAQQAIAAVALDGTRAEPIRQAALVSLADSATAWGNHLSEAQMKDLQELVKTGSGALALDAAKAYGALTPATANAVELIVK